MIKCRKLFFIRDIIIWLPEEYSLNWYMKINMTMFCWNLYHQTKLIHITSHTCHITALHDTDVNGMSSNLAGLAFLLPYSGLSRLLPSMSQRRGLWGDWGFPPSPACFGGVPLLWDPGAWETGEAGHWPVTWLPSSRHEWVGVRRPRGRVDIYFLLCNAYWF